MSRKDYFGCDFEPDHYAGLPEASSQAGILKAIEATHSRVKALVAGKEEANCLSSQWYCDLGPKLKTL